MGVAMAHIIEPVPSLLERSPNLPPTFERIIHKTLDKHPDNRYQTASQLAQAIHDGERQPSDRLVPAPQEARIPESVEEIPVKPEEVYVPPPQAVPMEAAHSSPVPVQRKSSFPRLVGGLGVLILCLCAGVVGGMASGLIPNPFANFPVQPSTTATSPTGPTLSAVTQTILPFDGSTTVFSVSSATPNLTPNVEIAVGVSTEVLLPYFTATTNMLCREGPGIEYVDRWQLTTGEVVQVLAQWYQDSDWLLVDINVPAASTRTDCCWVGAEGTLNVPLEQIKIIDFLPDRLDCSAVR